MTERFEIACALCGTVFRGFITHSHLRAAHGMTVAEYRAAGHPHKNEAYYQAIGAQNAGEKHPYWKGGRYIGNNGYVYIRVNGKYVLEHRHVMEQHLGRPLRPGEAVHHKDHTRTNNAPENLALLHNGEHVTHHLHEDWAEHGHRRSAKERTEVPCDNCGVLMSWEPSRLKRPTKHRFCSDACKYAFATKQPRRERSDYADVPCAGCGTPVRRLVSALQRDAERGRTRTFCSTSCHYAHRRVTPNQTNS